MQHVYAYKQCQRSNLELAYQHIHDAYKPDLNSMEVQDRDQLAQERQVATHLLDLYFENQPLKDADDKHIKKVEAEGRLYEKHCRKDREFLLNQMISTTERVADHYRLFLLLLVEFAEESHRDQQKKMSLTRPEESQAMQSAAQTNFYLNRAIQALRDSRQLHQQAEEIILKAIWPAGDDHANSLCLLVTELPCDKVRPIAHLCGGIQYA